MSKPHQLSPDAAETLLTYKGGYEWACSYGRGSNKSLRIKIGEVGFVVEVDGIITYDGANAVEAVNAYNEGA